MQESFRALARRVFAGLRREETALLWFEGEDSSFVRFNRGKVRQPGSVAQAALSVELIRGARHVNGKLALAGEIVADSDRVGRYVEHLRSALPSFPEDPHLLYNTEPHSSELQSLNIPPDPGEMTEQILAACAGLDFVGILAAGSIRRGFANSLGQYNWFSKPSFDLGFSLYSRTDKAVKASYSGLAWNVDQLQRKVGGAARELELMSRPAKTVKPGAYRVYLAPAALKEVLGLLSWYGFGLKNQRTRQTSLLRMMTGAQRLHASIDLRENSADGTGPAFGPSGFVKPDAVDLIRGGALAGALVSPRSSREFHVPTNGAADGEVPEALDLGAGTLQRDEVLARLDTGLYVNNLWYLNYSDRAACRITGMTRFATFWVERGTVQAPMNVMRFDETLYAMLGTHLVGLTQDRELLLDDSSYGQRSTASMRLPGALIDGMTFTL